MVRAIFKVCKRQCIPLYSSRFSRRDFTLWQHIALVALDAEGQKVIQRVRRGLPDHDGEKLIDALGLTKIHLTSRRSRSSS